MPITRSLAKSSALGSSTQLSDSKPTKSDPELAPALPTFEELQDDGPVCGRDAKNLRDATSSAISQVWSDSRATAAFLSSKINEGNRVLTQRLNDSFAAVGKRLDNLPLVAMFQPDSQGSRINPFSGYNEDGAQFSIWLRRLEDIMRMRPTPLSEEQQANFLVGHLEGVAREKVEELDAEARKSYTTIVAHLRSFFESPQQRYVARQKLSTCRQESGESCTAFANRVLNLVRAATSGQDATTQRERVLEEFVARLRGDVRYFVKLENPTSFEQAVTKAQTVEQLLTEATAERLLHPTSSSIPVQVLSRPGQARNRNPEARGRFPREPSRPSTPADSTAIGQTQPSFSAVPRTPGGLRCFNCHGLGYIASVCPSPRPHGSHRMVPQARNTGFRPRREGPQHRSPLPQANALSWDRSSPSRLCSPHSPLEPSPTMAQLTASLEDSQRQLHHSQARIEALLRRNDELTLSSIERKSPSQPLPSSASLPDVRFLLFTVVSLSLLVSPTLALTAWLCPADHSTFFSLPQHPPNCTELLPNQSHPASTLALRLYRPNTKLYSSPAFLCKIIRHSVEYSVSFFGVRREIHSETSLPVSEGECKQMRLHHRCVHGTLVEMSGVWRTSHTLTFSYPSAPFGCCATHTKTVTNCYLYPTTVHIRHADSTPQAPVGDLSACRYSDGACTLADGSLLMWTPDHEERCEYIFVARLSGHRLGSIWLSDDKEFALSWSQHSSTVEDCEKQLTITDQGYAIQLWRRSPRHTVDDAGLVTSNQLAAQLLAVEGATHSVVNALYRNALNILCDRTNTLATALHTSLVLQPTLTMRSLLSRPDISASYLGNGYIQVQRCISLPSVRLIRGPTPSSNRRGREAIFVPQSLREPICLALHDSPTAGGHFGWKKTLSKISRRFFWPTMRDDVFRYVRSCDACQRKRPHPHSREQLIPIHAGAIFDKVYMDLSGPYHQSSRGNKYILCLIDHFSKFVVAVAVPDSTALTVAHAIMTHCVLIFGAMSTLVSDNASYLKGELLSELGRLLQIGRYFTTPYHHEGNGACERMFATFQEMLRTYISSTQMDWDEFLPACTLAYNTSVHSSTNESPFFLMFGRDPILNIDLLIKHQMEGHVPSDEDSSIYKESFVRTLHTCWTAASIFNHKRSEAMKRQYDKNGLPPLNIKVGDRVYLRDYAPKPGLSPKLCYPWLGQFRVLAVDHPHLTITSITSPQAKPKRVHMNQVKRCFTLSGPVFTSPWIPEMEQAMLEAAQATTVTQIGSYQWPRDQARAVSMGDERLPLLAIQAAFGTGKTLVGALIAARLVTPGDLVIVTATTNVAVAQFTETLLSLNDYRHLSILRFLADKSRQEGAPVTPVDLHTVLLGLSANYSESLSYHDRKLLRRYERGRRLIETMLFHPERTVNLSEEEREEFKIAEMRNSEATERAVRIMLHLQFPSILCMTTASLMNSTKPGGLFYDLLSCCRTIIADEASQIPESVFVAMAVRFPQARHIYIGDVHQLQPHLRCPRTTLAARLGARGVMDLLYSKEVPLAPLVTTFRAHPALNRLPNTLVYAGTLVSGTPAMRRSGLIRQVSLPNPQIPFVLVNVHGSSRTSYSWSHYNEEEAHCCQDVIRGLLSRDVPPTAIGVISFYKEQSTRLRDYARQQGITLHTVDSVQGREMDVVIILTTRTHLEASTGEFLDDIKRLNVALTRCKHGQFVLGYTRALETLPHWNRVLQWAHRNNLVVDSSELADIFA